LRIHEDPDSDPNTGANTTILQLGNERSAGFHLKSFPDHQLEESLNFVLQKLFNYHDKKFSIVTGNEF
jgi:hypothetical protein